MKKIMFCGGGSAGHVIPNVALIECLGNNFQTSYIGTSGIEKNICKSSKIRFYECGAVKFVRGKFFCNLAIPFKLFKSVSEAGKILDDVKPDLLFCKGGYACVPPALAARKRNIPVITHESDVSAGLANKFIARKCRKVLTTFPMAAENFKNGICTGSPMRENIFGKSKTKARTAFGLDMRPTIIVLGGGSGSRIINENIRKNVSALCKNYNVLHICGKGNAVDTNIYGYKQIEFTDDIGSVYACADAAVSRCGSNTANELIAMKIPTLFIPLENRRSRGDQLKNAEYFKSLGLCRILREKELTPQSLLCGIDGVIKDTELKKALNKSAVKCGNDDIIREIISILR